MAESSDFGFAKLVPGFDFLQSLAKGASSAIPSMPQMPNLTNWVTPSLNLEELEKRVAELKAVHFWLEQNSKALSATITALEVQKMTLATLKGMNFDMGDVANALKLKAADSVVSNVQKAAGKVTETAANTARAFSDAASSITGGGKSSTKPAAKTGKKPAVKAASKVVGAGLGGLVDPLQLWGSLTQQFQQIASSAMKDASKNTAMDLGKNMATGLAKEAIKAGKSVAKKAVGKRR